MEFVGDELRTPPALDILNLSHGPSSVALTPAPADDDAFYLFLQKPRLLFLAAFGLGEPGLRPEETHRAAAEPRVGDPLRPKNNAAPLLLTVASP